VIVPQGIAAEARMAMRAMRITKKTIASRKIKEG
jgi:hypothetical protein